MPRKRKPAETANPLNEYMPIDPIMAAGWIGCVYFMLGHPEALEAFWTVTGNTYKPGVTPLERMIDEATGADLAWLKAFLAWHNANVWGEVDGKPIDAPGE